MFKRYTGEVAAPAHGERDTADCGQDDVTQGLPQIEAFIAVSPDTVQTCRRIETILRWAFNLSNDLPETHLKMTNTQKIILLRQLGGSNYTITTIVW